MIATWYSRMVPFFIIYNWIGPLIAEMTQAVICVVARMLELHHLIQRNGEIFIYCLGLTKPIGCIYL